MSVEEADVLCVLGWLSFGFVDSWLAGNEIKAAMQPFHGPLTPIAVAGWTLLVLVAAKTYDLRRLLGTAQIRAYRPGEPFEKDEGLIVSGFHATCATRSMRQGS